MSEPRLPSVHKVGILRVIGSLLALALLVYVLEQQGWGEIWAALKRIEPWRLGLGLLLILISRLIVSLRWYWLLRTGGIPTPLGEALRLNFAGLFANNFMLSTVGGDVIRLAGGIRLRYDSAVCAASLVVDRLIGMAGMIVVLPFGLPRLLAAGAAARSSGNLDPANRLLAGGLASLPLGGLLQRLWNKGWDLVRRVMSALALWIKQPGALILSLGLTWLHMACMFLFIELVLDGMGEPLPVLLIGGLYSLVYFVTLLPISINGYGVQEFSMTVVFAQLGGVSMPAAVTVALLFRTVMMLASLPGALFLPGLLPGRQKTVEASKE